MTREDAIKVLRTESVEIGGNAVSVRRFFEALDMAIAALMEPEGKDTYVPTNADRIRDMTDEELERFFIGDSPNYCHTGLCLDGETCIGCFLKWLQQPAEEDVHDERKENEHV